MDPGGAWNAHKGPLFADLLSVCFLFIAAVIINKTLLHRWISAPSVTSSYRFHLFSLPACVCARQLFHGALAAACVGPAVPVLIFSCCSVFQRFLNCGRPSATPQHTCTPTTTLNPHLRPAVQTGADVSQGSRLGMFS